MNACLAVAIVAAMAAGTGAQAQTTTAPAAPATTASGSSLRATWEMPAKCEPFAPARVADLKEELRQTGYRLAICMHPEGKDAKGEYLPHDLFVINADGTGLKQLTTTPDKDERVPRTAPDGKSFSYNYGDFIVDSQTFQVRKHDGGFCWAPDSKSTASCDKNGIVYTDVVTNKNTKPIKVERRVSFADLSSDGKWFIFEIRDYLGSKYSIDFMSSQGGPIRKLPNFPGGQGECHPGFSPDAKWMCWNSGNSLSIRKFDPALADGTDGKIHPLPMNLLGQDPCGRWSHCGRYIAYVKIPHGGSWKVHSPLCIVRIADNATITLTPPGWVGHHWDYDWLPPAEK
jgi:Tol biopolymer transport system component